MLQKCSFSSSLRILFLGHKQQVLRYLVVAIVMAAVGFSMLFLLVSYFGTNKLLANLALAPVMGAAGYLANRLIVFGSRPNLTAQSAPKWATYKLACFAASQLSFLLLVGPFGVQYLGARAIITAVLGPTIFLVGYIIADKWIFPKKGAEKA